MIDPETGRPFTVVSIEQPDGTFVAVVAENQQLRSEAESRHAAETKVADLFLETPSRRTKPNRGARLSKLLKIRVVHDKQTGQFETHLAELNGISTFGPTKQEALKRTEDLVRTYILGMDDLNTRIPLPKRKLETVRGFLGI